MNSLVLSGKLLLGKEFELSEGSVVIEDGVIAEISHTQVEPHYLVLPSLFNAHTHVGDGMLKDPPLTTLDELVKPPDGLKHRLLRSTPREEKVRYMRMAALQMLSSGCTGFADFREEGVGGVAQLDEAVRGLAIKAVRLGRPDGDDVSRLLEVCDGLGISGCDDHTWEKLSEWAAACRGAGGTLCIHAGEKNGHDVEPALELEPDVLVHMVHAETSELKRCASEQVSVVVCPRSNMLTGVGVPRAREMLELGVNVACGTDNVMIASCDAFEEMHALSWVMGLDEKDVLSMLTWRARAAYGLRGGVIEEGEPADLMVLDLTSPNMSGCFSPLRSVVRRAEVSDVCGVYSDGRKVSVRGR
ncbi:MAG: amidohydrolase family protein [Methermicoccaceae archaeon]